MRLTDIWPQQLEAGAKRPNAVWALCTSATRRYASRALQAAGVTPPEIFVAAEDVKEGKPACVTPLFSEIRRADAPAVRPDPYALGAKLCNAEPAKCLVLEDAPAGIISGHAAGCKTLGVITTHTREQMQAVKPDWLVKNLARSVILALRVLFTLIRSDAFTASPSHFVPAVGSM